jgi:hypothetical protein
VKVDKKKSFFVGDAAGRGKDHGKSDKEFATNCGLTFYTEEEFFSKDVVVQETGGCKKPSVVKKGLLYSPFLQLLVHFWGY